VNLAELKTTVRETLQITHSHLADAELSAILNDGYKQVAVLAACTERVTQTATRVASRFVPFATGVVTKVSLAVKREELLYSFVDASYTWRDDIDVWTDAVATLYDAQLGLGRIAPTQLGRVALAGPHPQFYFTWGDQLVIEPTPQIEYYVKVYETPVPSEAVASAADTLWELPTIFHSSVLEFAYYVACWKLKKWAQAGSYYNLFLRNLYARKRDYGAQTLDSRSSGSIPNYSGEGGRAWAH
jgi:hypothetical protein